MQRRVKACEEKDVVPQLRREWREKEDGKETGIRKWNDEADKKKKKEDGLDPLGLI